MARSSSELRAQLSPAAPAQAAAQAAALLAQIPDPRCTRCGAERGSSMPDTRGA